MASTSGAGEAESLVHPDRRDVVLVDVEHRLRQRRGHAGDAARPGSAPGRARCPARRDRPRPRRPRRGPALSCRLGGCTFVQWKPVMAPSCSAMKKPAGSNHGSRSRSSRSCRVQPPCSGCLAKARALRLSHSSSSWPGTKVRSVPAGREGRLGQRLAQRAAHLPQGAEALEARGGGQRGGRGQVAVRPDPQRVAARRGGDARPPGPGRAPAGGGRVDHELAAHLGVRVRIARRVQVGVARDLAVHGEDEVDAPARQRPVPDRAVVAQVQQHVLGQRRHAVGGRAGLHQVRGPQVTWAVVSSARVIRRLGHRAGSASGAPARAPRSARCGPGALAGTLARSARSPLTGTNR